MLTPAEVTAMAATAASALPDTCTVERKTTASDGGGGTTETWADSSIDVACRLAPLGGGEAGIGGGRINDETTHVVTLPQGADVTESDRLVIDDVTYEVTVVQKRVAWELTRRAEVKEAG